MDIIDHKIIELLASNARIDNRRIAQVVGTSDRTVARRIQKLEKTGVIEGYTVKLGKGLHSLVGIKDQDKVNTSISEWESIRTSLSKFFGSGSTIILFYIGYGIGKNLGNHIRQLGLTPTSQLLAFTQILEERGWGSLDFEKLDFQKAQGKLMVVNSPFKKKMKNTSCHEMKGILTGFLEIVLEAKMMINEVRCARTGKEFCEFVFREVG